MPRASRTKLHSSTLLTTLIVALLLFVVYAILSGGKPLRLVAAPQPTTTSIPLNGASGAWWQVYFTDPLTHSDPDQIEGSIPEKLVSLIRESTTSIDIAAFEFDLTPVAQALIDAHQRGVQVRWVTDDENGTGADAYEGHGQFAMLKIAGIPIRDDQRSALMHDKFIIFDRYLVWTGSTNLTVSGAFRNNNNVLVIDSPQLAAIYQHEFDEMWGGQFGPSSPSTTLQQTVIIQDTPIQVLFAPEDDAMAHIIPLVEAAQSSIRFMAFSFTYRQLGQALLERAASGVDVQGIFEARSSENEFSQLPPLYCAGLPVRQDGNPATFHHKVLVIDGQVLVTGSLNFSTSADESNDENVIILTNAEVAAQYLQEFDRRWAEAVLPDPAAMNCP
jgi:phosphatidylserine/phosphatidylglycerophosphate/cardiolipin synthase-like enzyme